MYNSRKNINDTILKDWTDLEIAAIQAKQKIVVSNIDFIDLIESKNADAYVIINLNLIDKITHTFPEINRCCKLDGRRVKFDGIDKIDRINCDIPKEKFIEKFINKREPIMITG